MGRDFPTRNGIAAGNHTQPPQGCFNNINNTNNTNKEQKCRQFFCDSEIEKYRRLLHVQMRHEAGFFDMNPTSQHFCNFGTERADLRHGRPVQARAQRLADDRAAAVHEAAASGKPADPFYK
jgi:hypothetical protein